MREMKDSGIEFIGLIPDNWEIRRMKSLGNVRNGLTYTPQDVTDEENGILVLRSSNIKNGKLCFSDNVYVSCSIPKDLLVKKGDILICSRNGSKELIGKNAIIDNISATFGAFMMIFRCNTPNYLYYVLNSPVFSYYLGTFFTSTINQLTGFNFGNMKVAYCPNLSEQDKIASYLDRKCSEIDALVTDIQNEIEMLGEYKRSVITEAVTKGLDPDVEMKDSGVEWIGDIPSHWEREKLKFHLKRCEPRNPGGAPVLSLYRDFGIVLKDSRSDNHNVTSEDTTNYKYVRKGDFVVNKMKAWQGSVAVSKLDGIVSPAYYIYHFINNNINKLYFHYLIRNCYKDEFRRLSGGIRVGQWDLPSEALDNTPVLLPPLCEQEKIAAYLDRKCSEIDSIIKEKQQQLETLAEYKKSLIYEYVTGKKEV